MDALTVLVETQPLRKRYIINYSSSRPFIRVRYKRYYLDDFSKEGYHLLSYTNCGYYAGFRIVGFDWGIKDYARVEPV